MGIFDALTAANFKVNSAGETLFFVSESPSPFAPARGYATPSDDDAAKLKAHLKTYHKITFFAAIPIMAMAFTFVMGDIDMPQRLLIASALSGPAMASLIGVSVAMRP